MAAIGVVGVASIVTSTAAVGTATGITASSATVIVIMVLHESAATYSTGIMQMRASFYTAYYATVVIGMSIIKIVPVIKHPVMVMMRGIGAIR